MNKSKNSMDSLMRLISPQYDLPPNTSHIPTVIITTSTGDPLRDDGIDLYQALKRHCASEDGTCSSSSSSSSSEASTNKIYHVEGRGSHAISFLFDKKENDRFIELWYNAIIRL
jgi:hypothetical protein